MRSFEDAFSIKALIFHLRTLFKSISIRSNQSSSSCIVRFSKETFKNFLHRLIFDLLTFLFSILLFLVLSFFQFTSKLFYDCALPPPK